MYVCMYVCMCVCVCVCVYVCITKFQIMLYSNVIFDFFFSSTVKISCRVKGPDNVLGLGS